MSLTPFQETKILKVFNLLYDINQDGIIEKKDFTTLLEKISSILSWAPGSAKYVSAQSTLDSVWGSLLKLADDNDDKKITVVEWKRMWGSSLGALVNNELPEWQKEYMNLMFDVNDKSGDNEIDQEEYTTFFKHFGLTESECHDAFSRLAGGSNISRAQFAILWKEYLTSNDSAAPGNFLFGPA